ncbi:MAG: Fe-S cluster assembly ATPase SufC [Firmicutes bacterium]|nr:Fe-S cluster assembly ATPase SufC [Bacillota bacterium]
MTLIIDNIDVVSKDNKKILDNFSLKVLPGEVHVIMGPNGTGKSTLSKVIMGNNDYKVVNGDILYKDLSIISLDVDERSRMGIFLAMQNPISIEGVSNSEFLRTAVNNKNGGCIGIYPFIKLMESSMRELKMDPSMMHRSINQDFSGGERKKNEILQMKLLKPELLILDELDSGLDVDSLKIVCDNINEYLKENPSVSVLMITHYSRILDYIKPKYVHVMKDGSIIKTGDFSLAKQIEKNGFDCVNSISENDNYE